MLRCIERKTVRCSTLVAGTTALLTGFAPASQAGHYVQISQTGGIVTWPGRPPAYRSTSPCGRYQQTNAYGGQFTDIFFTAGHFNISGAITTVFQWKPDQIADSSGNLMDDPADTPPRYVVINEVSVAETLNTDPDNPGRAANGLGSSAKPITAQVDFSSWGYGRYIPGTISSGSRSKLRAGGQTVKVVCSPYADITTTENSRPSNPNPWYGYTRYEIEVYAPTLNLTGVTEFGGTHNILIGQGCSASIGLGYGLIINPQWAITGDTFESYTISDAFAQDYPLNPINLQFPSPHWYWKGEGSATVSCTAQVCVPSEDISSPGDPAPPPGGTRNFTGSTESAVHDDGQSPPPGYAVLGTISLTSNVNVVAPDYYFAPSAGIVTINDERVGAGAPDPGSNLLGGKPGMTIDGRMRTPNNFWTNPAGGDGAGHFAYVQLIQVDYLLQYGLFYSKMKSTYGVYFLDSGFPYNGTATADAPPNHTGDILQFTDTPQVDFLPQSYSIVLVENFKVWMLYLPPGSDSSWVPIAMMPWGWTADASRNPLTGGTWAPQPCGNV